MIQIKFKEEFSMKKKILSIVLATAMVMGMSVTALADDPTPTTATLSAGGEQIMNGTGAVKEPTISIVVPVSFAIAVNPYKVPYVMGDATYTDQIVSVPSYIVNYSDVPVEVTVTDAKVTKDNASTVEVADTVTPATDKTKKIALQLDIATGTSYNAKTKAFGTTGTPVSAKFKAAPVTQEETEAYTYTETGALTLKPVTVAVKTTTVKGTGDGNTTAPEAVAEAQDSTTFVKTSSTAGVAVEGKPTSFTVETTTKTPSVAVLKITGSLVAQPIIPGHAAVEAVADDPETTDVDESVPAQAAVPDQANEWDKDADALTLQVKFNFKAIPNT
jgi:hypothetical protein